MLKKRQKINPKRQAKSVNKQTNRLNLITLCCDQIHTRKEQAKPWPNKEANIGYILCNMENNSLITFVIIHST